MATQRGELSAVAREEESQPMHDIPPQGTFKFPQVHIFTHYGKQIQDFGRLLQYYTEITEALHKPLEDAHRRSNRVDATEQILNTISRDCAIQMRELTLSACSRQIKVPKEIVGVKHEPARCGE